VNQTIGQSLETLVPYIHTNPNSECIVYSIPYTVWITNPDVLGYGRRQRQWLISNFQITMTN